MTPADIEKKLRATYPDLIKKMSDGECILVSDVVQIVALWDSIKKKPKTEHWTPLVDMYFVWYKEKFGFKPDFTGVSIKSLKLIIEKLQTIAKENNVEWSEKNARGYLKKILTEAYEDEWLKQNFLLENINKQFSKIRANARTKGGNETVGRIGKDDIARYILGKEAREA